MKRTEAKTVVPSADLFVCFPSKPICSPARCSSHHHRRRNRPSRSGAGKMSPLLLLKDERISEPTSPKVTCAGQIKVHPRVTRPNWRAVMAGMADGGGIKNKKKHKWVASLGFKKETFHLLDRLRSTRCDFQCFGWVLHTDEDEEEDREENRAIELETPRSMMFSKLFMVLPEKEEDRLIDDAVVSVRRDPPPENALLLMRCRSAPCRDWLQGEKESHEEKSCRSRRNEERKSKNLRSLMEEETRMGRSEDMVVKTETWIVGENAGRFLRSRSWKR